MTKTLVLWDIAENRPVWQRPIPDWPICIAFSPDGRTLAVGGGKKQLSGIIWLWRVDDGLLRQTLTGHLAEVQSLRFSHHRPELLVSGAGLRDCTIRFWNHVTGEELLSIPSAGAEQYNGVRMAMDFSPDESFFVTSNTPHGDVVLWQIGEEMIEPIQAYQAEENPENIWFSAFRHDGLVAVGGMNGKVYLWQVLENQL